MKIQISVGDDSVEFEVSDERMSELADGKEVADTFWKMYFLPPLSFLVKNLPKEA